MTGLRWDRVAAGVQSLAALQHIRKLTLVDNGLQHLNQVSKDTLTVANMDGLFFLGPYPTLVHTMSCYLLVQQHASSRLMHANSVLLTSKPYSPLWCL